VRPDPFLLSFLVGGVPLVEFVVYGAGAVDPGILVFAEEAVAAHEEAFGEAMAAHCEEHVAGTCGAKVTARAVKRADVVLMEEDDRFGGLV